MFLSPGIELIIVLKRPPQVSKDLMQHVLCAFCALCLTGRKAGRIGCWLLCDSVQTFGSSPHGPRSKQLQKVCSPQPVRHPPEPVHQCHAGTQVNTKSVFVSSWKFVRYPFYCNRTKLQILATKCFSNLKFLHTTSGPWSLLSLTSLHFAIFQTQITFFIHLLRLLYIFNNNNILQHCLYCSSKMMFGKHICKHVCQHLLLNVDMPM